MRNPGSSARLTNQDERTDAVREPRVSEVDDVAQKPRTMQLRGVWPHIQRSPWVGDGCVWATAAGGAASRHPSIGVHPSPRSAGVPLSTWRQRAGGGLSVRHEGARTHRTPTGCCSSAHGAYHGHVQTFPRRGARCLRLHRRGPGDALRTPQRSAALRA
jgi:hypothetical protein